MVNIESDQDVDKLRSSTGHSGLAELLGLLCGQPVGELDKDQKSVLNDLLGLSEDQPAWKLCLQYEQLNELLLLFSQPRVGIPFYQFFFQNQNPLIQQFHQEIRVSELGIAVTKFRGFAMLSFGNFRFAFRRLAEESDAAIFLERLKPWVNSKEDCEAEFNRRLARNALISEDALIQKDKTWQLGYFTAAYLYDDLARLYILSAKEEGLNKNQFLKERRKHLIHEIVKRVESWWTASGKADLRRWRGRLDRLKKQADKLLEEIEKNRRKGNQNTIRYLASEYIDVYVATSMREKWEFEDTFETMKLLSKHNALKDLRLRWFDPTQSYESSILDKSLLEGLMLKRVRCTVYMAQETETLGKDSELAATLAQGKPVIAFIPKIPESELSKLSNKLSTRPLEYFLKRLLVLRAEGFFSTYDSLSLASKRFAMLIDPKTTESDDKRIERLTNEVKKIEESLLDYVNKRTFRIVGEEERKFRSRHRELIDVSAKLLAACESVGWDNRASSIAKSHPLALQLNLTTGVANGVLIARSVDECAELIQGVLLNELKFRIEEVKDQETNRRLATVLVEKRTGSRFRVVTTNPTLTNSFWSFYLQK